jgi:hypothetical protein
MAKITAILSFVGVLAVIISMIYGGILGSQGKDFIETTKALFPVAIAIGLIGLATLVLGILLIVRLNKAGKPVVAGVLLIIAGGFSWIITFVALVLWIIAGIFLFRLKFDEDDEEEQEQVF